MLLFRLVAAEIERPSTAISVTMLAAAASSIHWLARPHLFTLLFLVLFYGALEHVREGRTRLAGIPYLAIFPVATVLWTNLHGGFFVGVVMIGAYGAAELLTRAVRRRPGRPARAAAPGSRLFPERVRLPGGQPDQPVQLSPARAHGRLSARPLELRRTSSNSFRPASIIRRPPSSRCMLVLGAAAACWHLLNRRFTEPLLMLLWAHAALLAARNIPIFVIVAAPPVAAALAVLAEGRAAMERGGLAAQRGGEVQPARVGNRRDRCRSARWHLASVARDPAGGGGHVRAASAAQVPRGVRPGALPDGRPGHAARRLPHARIFTNDEWGDYLIWSLYPTNRVFVDGRSDFYGDDFEEKYIDVLNVKYGWEKTLGHFRRRHRFIAPERALDGRAEGIQPAGGWSTTTASRWSSVPSTAAGTRVSVADSGKGTGRDREVTKTQASDRPITKTNSKT